MNVIDAAFPRDFHSPVGGPVVDDEPFDLAEPRHLPGEARKRFGQRAVLIVARNLYDELHGIPGCRVAVMFMPDHGDNGATAWQFASHPDQSIATKNADEGRLNGQPDECSKRLSRICRGPCRRFRMPDYPDGTPLRLAQVVAVGGRNGDVFPQAE